MRIKNGILLLFLFAGTVAFPDDAIIYRNYFTKDANAIEFSNHKQRIGSVSKYDIEVLIPAEKELIEKIKENPQDYSLYAALTDIYIKSKQYDKAIDNLVYLYNLKKNNLLNRQTLAYLNQIYINYKKSGMKDGYSYLILSILSVIFEQDNSLDYAVLGAERSHYPELINKTLSVLFDSQQDPKKAINVCGKILIKNPNNTEIRKIKAIYHTQLKEIKEAISEYTKVLEINPDDDEARYNLYKILSGLKTITEKETIKRLYGMQLDFEYEKAYISLIELLLKHNDFEDAKSYSETVIKKYEQNPDGYILMAEIYKKEGNIKEAFDTLSKARDKADNNETIAKYNVMLAKLSDEPVREANSLIANGLAKQALEVLDSANPENLYVILTQARANYILNNKILTFDLLNKAMSLFPNNSDVYCAFGYIYLQEKDIETARNYVLQSLKIDKNNKTAQDLLDLINKAESSSYTTSILDAMEAQNYQEALRLVNEAMSVDPKSADLYYYKSLINIALNNYSSAVATLFKCVKIAPDYTDAYFYLGAAFDNLNEKDNAYLYYYKFLNMVKGNEIGETERIEYAKFRLSKLKQN